MFNAATIVGNLGRDADVRFTQSGQAVANLSVATNEQWVDRESGERKKRTEWHRVVIFGALAEAAGKYYRKGKQVFVSGRLQTRQWQDKNGVDRWTTEIVAQTARLLGAAPEGTNPPHPAETADRVSEAAEARQAEIVNEWDDIPF